MRGEAQLRRKTRRILPNENAERREPEYRVWPQPKRSLDPAKPIEELAPCNSAKDKNEETALVHDLDGIHRTPRYEDMNQLRPDALPRKAL